jgi:hypothetical protein
MSKEAKRALKQVKKLAAIAVAAEDAAVALVAALPEDVAAELHLVAARKARAKRSGR